MAPRPLRPPRIPYSSLSRPWLLVSEASLSLGVSLPPPFSPLFSLPPFSSTSILSPSFSPSFPPSLSLHLFPIFLPLSFHIPLYLPSPSFPSLSTSMSLPVLSTTNSTSPSLPRYLHLSPNILPSLSLPISLSPSTEASLLASNSRPPRQTHTDSQPMSTTRPVLLCVPGNGPPHDQQPAWPSIAGTWRWRWGS